MFWRHFVHFIREHNQHPTKITSETELQLDSLPCLKSFMAPTFLQNPNLWGRLKNAWARLRLLARPSASLLPVCPECQWHWITCHSLKQPPPPQRHPLFPAGSFPTSRWPFSHFVWLANSYSSFPPHFFFLNLSSLVLSPAWNPSGLPRSCRMGRQVSPPLLCILGGLLAQHLPRHWNFLLTLLSWLPPWAPSLSIMQHPDRLG